MNKNFEEQKLSNETTKSYKINITGYLSIIVIDELDSLVKDLGVSRNSLLEEAVLDLLAKKKKERSKCSS